MAKISRRMAIDSVHKVLRAYQKKIEDGRNYTEYLPYAGRQIVKRYKDNEDNYKTLLNAAAQTEEFFTGMDDETLLSYVNVCHELNKIFDLKVSESRKIKGFIEETYYFEAGILYLDARGTGITISQMFEQLFPETNYSKDKEFYTKICTSCLGIENPDKIKGEYRVNLKNDYNDNTKIDGTFGKLMREKYISERYMKEGEAGRKKGAALLKQFDARHGTLITKSEKNTYAKNNIATIIRIAEFINSVLSKGFPFPFDKVSAMPLSLFAWYRRLRKAVLEITDKSKMTDAEKIELMRAIYDLKLRHPVLSALAEILPDPILKPLLQNNTYEAELTQKCSALIKPFGFTYAGNNTDYYYTLEHSLQSKFGFMDLYDENGAVMGMKGLKDTVIVFPYKDKEYRVEFWCGRYAYGNAYGAEIGIYYRPLSDALEKPYREKEKDSRFIYYGCVPEGEQFVMELHITVDSEEESKKRIINKTADYAQNGDHFWNLAIRTSQLKNINDMHVTGYIFTKNQELLKVMEYAISRKLKCGYKDSFLEVIIKR